MSGKIQFCDGCGTSKRPVKKVAEYYYNYGWEPILLCQYCQASQTRYKNKYTIGDTCREVKESGHE